MKSSVCVGVCMYWTSSVCSVDFPLSKSTWGFIQDVYRMFLHYFNFKVIYRLIIRQSTNCHYLTHRHDSSQRWNRAIINVTSATYYYTVPSGSVSNKCAYFTFIKPSASGLFAEGLWGASSSSSSQCPPPSHTPPQDEFSTKKEKNNTDDND